MNYRGIKLRAAVVGVKTVLLLLDVGELSVAESEHAGIVKQSVGKSAKTGDELLLGLGRIYNILSFACQNKYEKKSNIF